MAISFELPFSSGEKEMHRLLHVDSRENPTSTLLTPFAAYQLYHAPLLAVGAIDEEGRPWTSVWGGESGFAQPLSGSIVGLQTKVERQFDPVVQILMKGADESGVVKAEGKGKMIGGLTVDLQNRKRVKLFGHLIAGALPHPDEDSTDLSKATELQLAVKIDQSLGNCPKYMNKKVISPAEPEAKLLSEGPNLSEKSIELLNNADLFFMSTSNGDIDMDTNIRGGPQGFVRVISNDEDGAEIIYPEYSGNRLYQSLGNLRLNPLAGLVFPDFETGDVLYLTGKAEILIGADAAAVLPRTNLAVKIKITEAKFVEKGLTFHGRIGERSPYNPSVRLLAKEGSIAAKVGDAENTATLVSKTQITPTVSRYRFALKKPTKFNPGQWAAFDFSDELDIGYSHMRDDDPQSLNDDYVRTFTVSSWPDPLAENGQNEFDITVRRNGPVTSFLQLRRATVGLEVPMRGFGGDFQIKTDAPMVGFIAGGVGITPLLGQAQGLDLSKLHLIWTLPLKDIALVLDTLKAFPKLSQSTEVFFTGRTGTPNETEEEGMKHLKDMGVKIELRRLTKADILQTETEKWYLCASGRLRGTLLEWLNGKQVFYEDFNF